MTPIQACEPPQNALLRQCRERGAYTDCYAVEIPQVVSHAAYVEAFYTTWVFRLERLILRLLVSRPSTDAGARQLARGERDDFAAWSVEARAPDQLLLADFVGRTKSWLMVEKNAAPGSGGTRLYFGSAVVPVRDRKTGRTSLGAVHTALLGFHKLYSRVLLRAARARLLRQPAEK
jgi:hypothetical protein